MCNAAKWGASIWGDQSFRRSVATRKRHDLVGGHGETPTVSPQVREDTPTLLLERTGSDVIASIARDEFGDVGVRARRVAKALLSARALRHV